jgi:hypothetical protein
MAVVDKAGSVNNLSSIDTPNTKVADNVTNGGKIRMIKDTVEIAAADDDGSKFRLARVPLNAVAEDILLDHDAITGGTDYDLGLYDIPGTNNGAVIDTGTSSVDLLINGSDLSSAGSVNGLLNVDIADRHKKLWELAGFTEEQTKLVDITLTANTIGTAAGTVSLKTNFSLD